MTSGPKALTRSVDWSTWFLWVAVCAAEPVLFAIAATAFGKPVLETDPHATLIRWSLLILIVITLPAPVLLQWTVLRRIAPKLRWWIWLAGALVAWGVSTVLVLKARELSDAGRQFAITALLINTSSAYPATLSDLLGLPWGRTLISTVAVAAATMLVPTWIFARVAGMRWYVVLIAVIAGACTATTVDQIYNLYGFHIDTLGMGSALNGLSWARRMGELCLRAATGAVWGASSGLVIAQLIRKGDSELRRSHFAIHGAGGLAVMLASILTIAAAAPVCAIGLDPYKARAGLAELRKAFSFPPSSDISEGEEVLRFSHLARVDPTQYSMAHFAPDGKSFITVTAGRRLLRIDVENGKSLGTVGDQFGRHERHGLAWSHDGSFLALRTDGEEVAIPNTPYTRHRARFRIYALPEHKVAGEYSHREDECFDSFADPSMMFELDGKSLWVLCGQYAYPGPDSLLAIKLEVPSMRVLQLRRYGESAASQQVRGLARIGPSIWYWQHRTGKAEQLRVRDLSRDQDVVYLRDLDQACFADNFTSQEVRLSENRISLRYHGGSDGQTTIKRWLVFDTRSGSLIERKDEPNPTVASSRAVSETPKNLRIETTWREDSKAGKIDVIDSVSGKQRQHISSLAQRPVGISPDGRWLVMNAFEQKALRIYRAMP